VTCRELVERLPERLAGELRGRKRIGVAIHLLLCAACRAYLASYRTTVGLARRALAEEGGEVRAEDLEAWLRALREGSRRE
jgi:predicted anti-sigma-YlaC factor YlaD